MIWLHWSFNLQTLKRSLSPKYWQSDYQNAIHYQKYTLTSEYLNAIPYKVSECWSAPFVGRNCTTWFGRLMRTTRSAVSAAMLGSKSSRGKFHNFVDFELCSWRWRFFHFKSLPYYHWPISKGNRHFKDLFFDAMKLLLFCFSLWDLVGLRPPLFLFFTRPWWYGH